MNAGASQFTCQACGHTFMAAPELIARQPTCPRCRTYGKLAASGGRPVAPRRAVRPAAQRQPAHQHSHHEEAPVEVSAAAVYGPRSNPKSVVKGVLLVVLGLGIVGVLAFIVTTLSEDHAAKSRMQKEQVLDQQSYEQAVNVAIDKTRTLLSNVAGAQVEESSDFSEVMSAIRANGGSAPSAGAALRPGSPVRAQGFLVRTRDQRTGQPVVGFVMLLYYTTAQQVEDAHAQLSRELSSHATHISMRSNKSMWFLAYSGASHGGALYDALKRSMSVGQPVTFKQFTDRIGATGEYQ